MMARRRSSSARPMRRRPGSAKGCIRPAPTRSGARRLALPGAGLGAGALLRAGDTLGQPWRLSLPGGTAHLLAVAPDVHLALPVLADLRLGPVDLPVGHRRLPGRALL